MGYSVSAMKQLIAALALLSLASCASSSVYLGAVSSTYEGGMQDTATDEQSGVEAGLIWGEGLLVGDVGFRSGDGSARTGNGGTLESEQTVLSIGTRLYASRDWIINPYVGVGMAHQRNSFENGWTDSDVSIGTYARLGADVRLSDVASLTLAWESLDSNTAAIGDRRLDFNEAVIMVGISFDL